MKKKKKVKEPTSELLVNLFVKLGIQTIGDEELQEMLNVGVTDRQLPAAALGFAMDGLPNEFDDRLNESERKAVEKKLKAYFKGKLS